MDAHATAADTRSTRTRPGSVYAKVGLVLFVLTALEVGLYEITYGEHAGATGHCHPALLRSAAAAAVGAKFALVAMFYMHLKQDQPAVHRRVRVSR